MTLISSKKILDTTRLAWAGAFTLVELMIWGSGPGKECGVGYFGNGGGGLSDGGKGAGAGHQSGAGGAF